MEISFEVCIRLSASSMVGGMVFIAEAKKSVYCDVDHAIGAH